MLLRSALVSLVQAAAAAVMLAQAPGPPSVLLPDATRHPVVLLWPQGAPGSEGKSGEEKFRIERDLLIVSSVHRPSLTLYLPPKERATGAGTIVIPGGSFREIWITHEGYRIGDWLAQHGIAAFVLKYRLAREAGSTYTTDGESLADIQRAIRIVRSRAAEWSVDPDRVGVMGFSAGGALAGMAGTRYNQPVGNPVDDIDRLSARPAFQALIYGSPFSPPMKSDVALTKDTPQAFLVSGGDDRIVRDYPDVYKLLRDAGVPTELHIYAGVGHGFGIQPESASGVAAWLDRFRDWLFDRGLLHGK